MINIAEIEKTARDATPGPWHKYTPKSADTNSFGIDAGVESVFVFGFSRFNGGIVFEKDADHIAAANPTATLEMVGLIRELAKVLDTLVKEVAGSGLVVNGNFCGDADTEAAAAVLEKARRAGVEV